MADAQGVEDMISHVLHEEVFFLVAFGSFPRDLVSKGKLHGLVDGQSWEMQVI